MNKLDEQRQKEIQQAEELLFAGPQALGFAKGLFQGHFVSDWVMPYPRIPEAQQGELDQVLTELRKFLNADLDPAEIDRQADIPRSYQLHANAYVTKPVDFDRFIAVVRKIDEFFVSVVRLPPHA